MTAETKPDRAMSRGKRGPVATLRSPRCGYVDSSCSKTRLSGDGDMAIKASDLFIQCLEEEGVEYIFGVPGEENLDFPDSLSRSKKIALILHRHEQGAGFMAATARKSVEQGKMVQSV